MLIMRILNSAKTAQNRMEQKQTKICINNHIHVSDKFVSH